MKNLKTFRLIVLTLFLSNQVLALPPAGSPGAGSYRDSRRLNVRDQAEYFNANPDQRLEARVNFVGGVKQSGIYHFPDTTNLMEAISLAGGTVDDADLSKVYVKREGPKGYTTFQYDLTRVISENNLEFPVIKDRDTILIEVDHSSQNTLTRLTVISLIASIVSTAFVIHQATK